MTAAHDNVIADLTPLKMEQILATQRQHFMDQPMPERDARIAKLKALKAALLRHKQQICDALAQDYGQRSHHDSLLGDIMPGVLHINYTIKNLKKWMKPSRRKTGLLLSPAKVEVVYQPLGVVGIIVPWNFPVMLSMNPLITAIAAGNRAMIKLSEFTPATNSALRAMLASVFDSSEVAVIEGESDVAAAFSALPFDHLIFTGSTTVGRHVMRAAADNLTPVTLELGGKSPAIIAPDMPIEAAVERIIFGKSVNAGQICVAPDYVLVPEEKMGAFVKQYKKQFAKMYPDGIASKDFTSVANTRQYQRLIDLLDDARAKGAKIVVPCENARDDSQHRMLTHLILNPTDEMSVMQEEIFGPLLSVKPYKTLEQAIDYVQQRPRPLALYLMSFDKELQQKVIVETHSGGMAINEAVFHVAAKDAPFGGIGPSGMGHYHGKEGFLTFSKAKTVLSRGKINSARLIHPPYGGLLQKLMLAIFLR